MKQPQEPCKSIYQDKHKNESKQSLEQEQVTIFESHSKSCFKNKNSQMQIPLLSHTHLVQLTKRVCKLLETNLFTLLMPIRFQVQRLMKRQNNFSLLSSLLKCAEFHWEKRGGMPSIYRCFWPTFQDYLPYLISQQNPFFLIHMCAEFLRLKHIIWATFNLNKSLLI